MASTTIAVSTSLDVIDRYRELVEASLDGDSIYIRAKETVERLYENSEMSGAKKAEIVASTVTSMAASISANCMQLALQWESQESELGLKKEELEYKIDLMKLEADKAKQDVAASEANKHLLQAKLIREYGNKTVNADGDVVLLDDSGLVYEQVRASVQDTANKALLSAQIASQTEEVQARTHKLVADTYVNHGLFTGYTITDSGIASATKVATGYVTLSDMNKQVAKEQAKGYAWNAWSNAASSSAGMIGTLVAAEITNESLVTSSLGTWSTAVTKLNTVTEPVISI